MKAAIRKNDLYPDLHLHLVYGVVRDVIVLNSGIIDRRKSTFVIKSIRRERICDHTGIRFG